MRYDSKKYCPIVLICKWRPGKGQRLNLSPLQLITGMTGSCASTVLTTNPGGDSFLQVTLISLFVTLPSFVCWRISGDRVPSRPFCYPCHYLLSTAVMCMLMCEHGFSQQLLTGPLNQIPKKRRPVVNPEAEKPPAGRLLRSLGLQHRGNLLNVMCSAMSQDVTGSYSPHLGIL